MTGLDTIDASQIGTTEIDATVVAQWPEFQQWSENFNWLYDNVLTTPKS